MALEENGCHQNVSVDSRISGNAEEDRRLPLVVEQEENSLGWMEEDLEEEWERKSRSPSSYNDPLSSSTEDHGRLLEDLLAEWFEIEAELGASEALQPAGSSMDIHESFDMKTAVEIAEWQLLEGSQETELKLDGMIE